MKSTNKNMESENKTSTEAAMSNKSAESDTNQTSDLSSNNNIEPESQQPENKKIPKQVCIDQMSFVELLPKVELHAHLSGSISLETIKMLIEERDERVDLDHIPATLYNQIQSQFDKENKRY